MPGRPGGGAGDVRILPAAGDLQIRPATGEPQLPQKSLILQL